jgi:hypothetical protein
MLPSEAAERAQQVAAAEARRYVACSRFVCECGIDYIHIGLRSLQSWSSLGSPFSPLLFLVHCVTGSCREQAWVEQQTAARSILPPEPEQTVKTH